jgi:hypothetical protein
MVARAKAAAVLSARDVATVAREWAPADAHHVEPDTHLESDAVRGAYRDLARRTHPGPGDPA